MAEQQQDSTNILKFASRYNRKVIGIYKITNLINNKIYIGQSWDILKRKYIYSRNLCKSQRFLYNSFIKYGTENFIFEIIHELPIDVNQEILNNYEILYWQLYKDCNSELLNIREPGSNGKLSDETKKKISESHLKLGYKASEETKQKLRDSHKTRIYTSRKKLPKIKSIKKILTYGSKKDKIILDVNTGIFYTSVSEAARIYNFKEKTLHNWINEKSKNKSTLKYV